MASHAQTNQRTRPRHARANRYPPLLRCSLCWLGNRGRFDAARPGSHTLAQLLTCAGVVNVAQRGGVEAVLNEASVQLR